MGAGDLEQHGVKHIINAVGPRWDNGDDAATFTQRLSNVVRQALIEAQANYCSSVALNAISTGLFKGPLQTCSVIIVNSIRIYFQDYPGSCIKKVSITNNDLQTCRAIEQALKVAMGEVEVEEFDASSYRVRKTLHSSIHPLYTHYTLAIHSLYTHYTLTSHLTIHSPYTHHTLTIHSRYTHFTPHYTLTIHLTIHSLYTHYTLTIDSLYTQNTFTILYTHLHYRLAMHPTLYTRYTLRE
jgi:hypothetical protein